MTLLAKKKTNDPLVTSSVEDAADADAGADAGADAPPPVPNAEADEQSEAGDTAATPALPKVAVHDDEESILLETTKLDLKDDEEPEGMSEYLDPSQLMVVLGACPLSLPQPHSQPHPAPPRPAPPHHRPALPSPHPT